MANRLLPLAALALFFSSFASLTGGEPIGVNYGMLGNNLPPPEPVVSLLISRNIMRVRLFIPHIDVLKALGWSDVEVVLGTLNEDLPRLAFDPSFATQWVDTNVVPYANSTTFRYITAGNEVIPGEFSNHVLLAMQNLDAALAAADLQIPVTTVVAMEVLGVSYPPSQGAFSDATAPVMTPLLSFLASKSTPLLVNVYPYFAYASDTQNVQLDFALFTATGPIVQDGPLNYSNLFDAMLDATYSAMEKAGVPDVQIAVSETGWPSGGGAEAATVENAMTYNNNVVKHVGGDGGTPKRPGSIETYLFSLFNENKKPEGTEQNFGLYRADMSEVYHVDFP